MKEYIIIQDRNYLDYLVNIFVNCYGWKVCLIILLLNVMRFVVLLALKCLFSPVVQTLRSDIYINK